jgi:hypothetical protein
MTLAATASWPSAMMSAENTTLSPIALLAGNLPSSICGATLLITTRFLPSSVLIVNDF